MNKSTIAIIGLTVIAAVFGLYAAFAKTTTTVDKGDSSHEVGGVGDSILTSACAIIGIKC